MIPDVDWALARLAPNTHGLSFVEILRGRAYTTEERARVLSQFKETKTMNFIPMNDRVLLRGLASEEVSRIIVPKMRLIKAPEIAAKTPQLFEVLAVGPLATVLKVGDRVAMSEFLGTKLEFDGVEHIVAVERDVLGVFKEETPVAPMSCYLGNGCLRSNNHPGFCTTDPKVAERADAEAFNNALDEDDEG